jgi:hypothetical protein
MGEIERQLKRARAGADKPRAAAGLGGVAGVLLSTLAPEATDVERYRHAVLQVHAAAALLQQHNIPDLLAAIDRADSVGPMFDPTAWKEKHAAMAEDREALQAARALWLFGRRMEQRRAMKEGD